MCEAGGVGGAEGGGGAGGTSGADGACGADGVSASDCSAVSDACNCVCDGAVDAQAAAVAGDSGGSDGFERSQAERQQVTLKAQLTLEASVSAAASAEAERVCEMRELDCSDVELGQWALSWLAQASSSELCERWRYAAEQLGFEARFSGGSVRGDGLSGALHWARASFSLRASSAWFAG